MVNKILVIDDEAAMLQLLERILSERAGCRVKTTVNSLETPEILERESFDLVITDLRMPGMSGLDVARWIREHNRTEEVIILTAYGTLEAAQQAMELGVGVFLTKPVKRERLLAEVDRAFMRGRQRQWARGLEAILAEEPYASAESAFRAAYLNRLVQAAAGDTAAVAKRSGIDEPQVRQILTNQDKHQGKSLL